MPPESNPSAPPETTRLAVPETAVRAFEAAWLRGERPDIAAAVAGLAAGARAAALVELAHAEMELRLKAGEPARVEDYPRRFPELDVPEVVCGLIEAECRLRRRRESDLTFAEYNQRFPGLAPHLAELEQRLSTVRPAARSSGAAGSPRPTALPVVPGYEILAELGRGGMGVVYRARQAELGRVVALKMVRGAGGEEELARFRAEAVALAKLQHPNIVQVHEVGLHGGQPFFSLEYVEGGSLDKKLAGAPRPARQSAEVVRVLAGAVHAAHQAGIVHRDLKPANVLVGAGWVLKVTDFGLAKQLDADSGRTRTGQVMGTPSYMAPEQAAGDPKSIGPATDVYALGAILYECLTGRPPFKGATVMDTLDLVRTEEPVTPRALNAKVPRDLETVCLKCLQKEPARRYPSAEALAGDLARFLAGEPVSARPVGRAERAMRWAWRHPVAAALGAVSAVAVASLVAAVVGLFYSGQLRDALGRASKGEADAKTAQGDAERLRNEAIRLQERAEAAEGQTARLRYFAGVALAQRIGEGGEYVRMRDMLDELGKGHPGQADLPGFEWHYLQAHCPLVHILSGHKYPIAGVSWSPDGRHLASACWDSSFILGARDGGVKVWDARTGGEVVLSPPAHASDIHSVGWSPDGKRLAGAAEDGTLKVWDAATGREALSIPARLVSRVRVAWSPDGRRLAATGDGQVHAWDAESGRETLTVPGQEFLAWSPDGRRLASAFNDGTAQMRGRQVVRIWDAQTGEPAVSCKEHKTKDGKPANVTGLGSWAPDGKHLAAGAQPGFEMTVWDAQSGEESFTIAGVGYDGPECWSPDGKRLATLAPGANQLEGLVKVYEAETGKEVSTLRGHRGRVSTVAWAPDGKHLASAAEDKTVRVWDAATGQEALALPAAVSSLAWAPDGRRLATASADTTVKVWDVAAARGSLTFPRRALFIGRVLAWNPDGRRLALSNGIDGTVKVLDTQTGQETVAARAKAGVAVSVAWSPDGKRLASTANEAMVQVTDVAAGRAVLTLGGYEGQMADLDWSPDDTRLVSAAGDNRNLGLRFWDARTGRQLFPPTPHRRGDYSQAMRLTTVRWSPDGRRIAAASATEVAAWPPDGGEFAMLVKVGAWDLSWGPEGKRLAGACSDGEVKVWDVATGEVVLRLRGHTGRVARACFSPDGRRITSAGLDGTVKVWDAATGQEALTLRGHTGEVYNLAWSPDGRRIASASGAEVKVWEAGPAP